MPTLTGCLATAQSRALSSCATSWYPSIVTAFLFNCLSKNDQHFLLKMKKLKETKMLWKIAAITCLVVTARASRFGVWIISCWINAPIVDHKFKSRVHKSTFTPFIRCVTVDKFLSWKANKFTSDQCIYSFNGSTCGKCPTTSCIWNAENERYLQKVHIFRLTDIPRHHWFSCLIWDRTLGSFGTIPSFY